MHLSALYNSSTISIAFTGLIFACAHNDTCAFDITVPKGLLSIIMAFKISQ